jgi:hypothetical protein
MGISEATFYRWKQLYLRRLDAIRGEEEAAARRERETAQPGDEDRGCNRTTLTVKFMSDYGLHRKIRGRASI